MNINQDPMTLDPRQGYDLVSSSIHFLLFEGLMRKTGSGELVPGQAESVEISEDGLTYVFHLRECYWSNGQRVRAQDFEKSWKKILSPHFVAPNAPLFYLIKNAEKAKKGEVKEEEIGISCLDENRFKVELDYPAPYFLNLTSFCVFFPVNADGDEKKPDWWKSEVKEGFICNGPFTLAEWKHGDKIVVDRNPRYWDSSRISLEHIHVSMIADSNTALKMFENGQLDMLGFGISPIPYEALPYLKTANNLKTLDSTGSTFITFNVDKPPFNSLSIRKAFALALNRQEIVSSITQMGEKVASCMVPPPLKEGKEDSLLQDNQPERAKQLLQKGLEELGIEKSSFPKIVYTYAAGDVTRKLAQIVQRQIKDVLDIDIVIEHCDYKTLLSRLGQRQYHMASAIWVAQFDDIASILGRFSLKQNAKNYPGWESSRFVQLLNASNQEQDSQKRRKLLDEAETIFAEELPLIPIFHWRDGFMVQPYVIYPPIAPGGFFDYASIRLKNSESKKS